jgi:hypothetical protein
MLYAFLYHYPPDKAVINCLVGDESHLRGTNQGSRSYRENIYSRNKGDGLRRNRNWKKKSGVIVLA